MHELAADLRLALDPALLLRLGGFEPDEWQQDLARGERSALALTGRQVGKTTAGAATIGYEALYRPGSLSLILAPTQRQATELLWKTRHLLSRALPELEPASSSSSTIELPNGSRIIALPNDPNTIRGYSATLMLIDEAGRVPDDLYHAATPMLAVTGGRIVALTTPAGPRGWFYQAWRSGNDDWQRIRIRSRDCPRITPGFLEQEGRHMTDAVYAAEYECAFTDPIGAVFPSDHVRAAYDETLTPLYPEGGW